MLQTLTQTSGTSKYGSKSLNMKLNETLNRFKHQPLNSVQFRKAGGFSKLLTEWLCLNHDSQTKYCPSKNSREFPTLM